MGFLEDFGKKVSATANTATSKTKDFAAQKKLESDIHGLENNKKAYFTRIGEMIYQAELSGLAPAQYDEIIEAIRGLDQQIAEKKEQIRALKEQIACPRCGKMIPMQAQFCPYCGESFVPMPAYEGNKEPSSAGGEEQVKSAAADAEQEAQQKICPVCGNSTETENRFCPACGAKLEEAEA